MLGPFRIELSDSREEFKILCMVCGETWLYTWTLQGSFVQFMAISLVEIIDSHHCSGQN